MRAAILTDTTKCVGCSECVIACKKANGLPRELPRRWSLDDGLSARNWTSVVEGPGGTFVRKQCRHCLEPACASACPVGALGLTDFGAVIYDRDKCMGCRYCMLACPYGIPRYDWDQPVPYVRKCTLCHQRLREGEQPACTSVCPTKATIFGDRDELIAEARRRIRYNPGKYIDRVWGEREAGGTSVLYISEADLSFLTRGQSLGETPVPQTTAIAMNAVPFAFTGVMAAMAAVNWIVGRRMRVQDDSQGDGDTRREHG
jgi:formate dehydrogenase iron-sulfur subunit